MLKKESETIHYTSFLKQFASDGVEERRNRPLINQRDIGSFVPYKHFKKKGLHCLKFLLQESDFLCKIDLKDAHLSVPLYKSSRKLVRFL